RRGGADDRADGDRIQRDPRPVLRRHDPDRTRGGDRPGSDSQRPHHDPGPPPGPDAGGATTEPALAVDPNGSGGGVGPGRVTAFRLLVSPPARGADNMALDEALLTSRLQKLGPPTVRFFAWCPPAISLGYGQILDGGIDLDEAARLGI